MKQMKDRKKSDPAPSSHKVATAEQMRALDREVIERYGIPGIVLMENAALGVVRAMEERYGDLCGKKVVVICGKGNNGGDGFAVARHLSNRGAGVHLFLPGDPNLLRGDAATNLRICRMMKIPLVPVTTNSGLRSLASYLSRCDLVIDALLGTGIKPPVRGMIAEVIKRINRYAGPVISVDLPSGLSADTSAVLGEVVEADLTVTFGLSKISLTQYPSLSVAGHVVIADISLPVECVEKAGILVEWIGDEILRLLPKRRADAHKGSVGKVLLVAGSKGMPGAAVMTALSALRVGTGLVYAALPSSIEGTFLKRLMEGIVIPLDDSDRDHLTPASLRSILQAAKGKNVVAVGPGIGLDPETGEMVRSLIQTVRIPVILDADGINQIAADPEILRKAKAPLILTPHPGEMARLTGVSKEVLTTLRIDLARSFAREFGVILILKGARTVIADPGGRCWINTTGNSGMGTAGMGDLLTGMIAGLVAQGMNPLAASKAGVYIHGLCGDRAAGRLGKRSLIARDLLHEVPCVLKACG
ncbi:MAG: NAD(P)H-hydrate dehydratase [Deltaproteobacteria bacterium]|nr:NAD(P)H-hydrate dehydratase [Deltaproteobacteria bacterium]